MKLPYKGATTILQGILQQLPEIFVIQVCSLVVDQFSCDAVSAIPKEIAVVLSDFEFVFAPFSSLPPERTCDHTIPLIPGAKPVHVRAYRYPPPLKDEIETQVTEMLAKGLIQISVSEFASPVLLVKKKDRSWHFCVDYRYLNVVTLKSKFPIPVFDQLMDELAKASWFYFGSQCRLSSNPVESW
jgi:hypothetical protein